MVGFAGYSCWSAPQHGACIMMHKGQLYAQCTEFPTPPGDGTAVIASVLLQLVLRSGELSGCKATPRASEGLPASQQKGFPWVMCTVGRQHV